MYSRWLANESGKSGRKSSSSSSRSIDDSNGSKNSFYSSAVNIETKQSKYSQEKYSKVKIVFEESWVVKKDEKDTVERCHM